MVVDRSCRVVLEDLLSSFSQGCGLEHDSVNV